jgi:hypothetical protein
MLSVTALVKLARVSLSFKHFLRMCYVLGQQNAHKDWNGNVLHLSKLWKCLRILDLPENMPLKKSPA